MEILEIMIGNYAVAMVCDCGHRIVITNTERKCYSCKAEYDILPVRVDGE